MASIRLENLSAFYGDHLVVDDVTMTIEPKKVTALIGPSGCGKSTVLRCINAMHMTVPGARATGRVLLDEQDVLREMDPTDLRRRVGMVFQRPNPFPTLSVYDNVIAGLQLGRKRRRGNGFDDLVERSLRQAGLWEEVKDRLNVPGASLSGGQQQRLCIARTLAVEPEVVLMDEPCSALDPIATSTVEDTIDQLKDHYTIIIVTHNMQQASRVSQYTAFLTITQPGEPGRLIEIDQTENLFSHPRHPATEDYITGKFG
ncbi:phosphate ABC transporter ATP-binding protein PstB [Nocardia sp. NPDC004860]|uniref:phosphate ABC transporter ATP-binding protein PstB n=1 Tax=Nocardia sp. NPDC004860 TaxID=3154557 RepID=UPI0033B20833